MSHTYEIEIKTLLGTPENAEMLRDKLRKNDSKIVTKEKHSQLNHYFNAPHDTTQLHQGMKSHIPADKQSAFTKVLEEGNSFSIRTREADGVVFFIVKASVDEHTSDNGISRIEFETKVAMTLDELDQVLLDTGLTYQAKWSREREEYETNDITVTIDKNAGYGYLAEFEKVVDSDETLEDVRKELATFMNELGVEELPQERLERMFAHYNANWEKYYGTDNIFVIE